MKRERLFGHIPEPRTSKYGITNDDILRVSASSELVADLLECLRSEDELDLIFALMFAEQLSFKPDFMQLLGSSTGALTTIIRSSLTHSNSRIKADAIRAFVAYRSHYSDYSEVMLSYLNDSDPLTRREALIAAPTFIAANELAALLPFRNDTEVSETLSMGGPLRYITRDLALSVAEHIAGRKFSGEDSFEHMNGSHVSWQSWSPFTQWLETQK